MFIDFEYDGKRLSDFGFIPCMFDNDSDNGLISSIGKLTYNKVSGNHGKQYSLTSTQYDDCIETAFDICKKECQLGEFEIRSNEYRELMRWLNRRGFYRFRAIDDTNFESEACYYNASFNIEKKYIGNTFCGLELSMTTDKPFGFGSKRLYRWTVTADKKSKRIIDCSDEIGYIYPDVEITCNAAGNLQLTNSLDAYTTIVKNCSKGEVIKISGGSNIISTSLEKHKIYNDFNFEFPKIINTATENLNIITCSIPCSIKLGYEPVIKEII